MKRDWESKLTASERLIVAGYDLQLKEIDSELAELRIKVQRLVYGGSAALKHVRETWAPVIEAKGQIAKLQCQRMQIASHRHRIVNKASAKAGKAKAA